MSHHIGVGDHVWGMKAGIYVPVELRVRPGLQQPISYRLEAESSVLVVLNKPAGWRGNYPARRGNVEWWYLRGHKDKPARTDPAGNLLQYDVVEGWAPTKIGGNPVLDAIPPDTGCPLGGGAYSKTVLKSAGGGPVYVTADPRVHVRRGPGMNADVIDKLPLGYVGHATGEHKCADGMMYWKLEYRENGRMKTGWVSEWDAADKEWLLVLLHY